MCGRYYVDDETLKDIERVLREVDRKIKQRQFNKDIHPTDQAPVIHKGDTGLCLSEQTWGYPGVKNKGVIFNARAESVLDKRMFTQGVQNNRIVVPATKFYEWNKQKEMNIFRNVSGEPLYLAGFYAHFAEVERFVILTTAANASMQQVHDRMPLILEANQIEEWIIDNSRTEDYLRRVPMLLDRISAYEQQSFL